MTACEGATMVVRREVVGAASRFDEARAPKNLPALWRTNASSRNDVHRGGHLSSVLRPVPVAYMIELRRVSSARVTAGACRHGRSPGLLGEDTKSLINRITPTWPIDEMT